MRSPPTWDLQRSPSSFNLQPYQIIMVPNVSIRRDLADRAMIGPGNQYRTRDCSVLAVFIADLEAGKRISRIHQLEQDGYYGPQSQASWTKRSMSDPKQASGMISTPNTTTSSHQTARHPAYLATMPLYTSFLLGEGHLATWLKQTASTVVGEKLHIPVPTIEPMQSWSTKQTALAIQSYLLAATSHDLATCAMEGFHATTMKEILRIPDRYTIPVVVATGYEYEPERQQRMQCAPAPRLPLHELVFENVFGSPYQQLHADENRDRESYSDDDGVDEQTTGTS